MVKDHFTSNGSPIIIDDGNYTKCIIGIGNDNLN